MAQELYALELNAFNKLIATKNALYKDSEKLKSAINEFLDKGDELDILSIDGNVANIYINGFLTPAPTFWDYIVFGSVTKYSDIINAIRLANQNNSIESIYLNIDSPGGSIADCDLTSIVIKNSQKPVYAIVNNLCASAAYWLASQSKAIYFTADTDGVGSIGVRCMVIDDSKYWEEKGIFFYDLVSENAPKKVPDISRQSGRQLIIDRLTELENVFIQKVASGRGVSVDTVKNDFGKGGVVIAKKAVSVSMIDYSIFDLEKIKFSDNSNSTKTSNIKIAVGTFDDEAEIIDETWNKAESERRWRSFTNSDEEPNNENSPPYHSRFCWWDDENPQIFGSYKLPVKDIKENKVVINIRAVRNAKARLSQTDIPESDRERVENLLDRYLAKWREKVENEDSKESNREEKDMDINQLKLEHAQIYSDVFNLGVESERKRVANLEVWRGKSDTCDNIINEAIISGKSFDDVHSQLSAAASGNIASVAQDEQPGPISAVDESANLQGDSGAEDETRTNELASAVAANAMKGV